MKKLIILITFFVMSGIWSEATAQETFHRKTKHRTVKTLKRHELRKIQSGHNLYSRDSRGSYKTSRLYSGISRPKDAARKKDTRLKDTRQKTKN
jgi:hypothetical protein